jgi:hypothetical protein
MDPLKKNEFRGMSAKWSQSLNWNQEPPIQEEFQQFLDLLAVFLKSEIEIQSLDSLDATVNDQGCTEAFEMIMAAYHKYKDN